MKAHIEVTEAMRLLRTILGKYLSGQATKTGSRASHYPSLN
jgi:hypothetical protein